jgi:hypothetical protein
MVPAPQAVKAEMRKGGSEKTDYRNLLLKSDFSVVLFRSDFVLVSEEHSALHQKSFLYRIFRSKK